MKLFRLILLLLLLSAAGHAGLSYYYSAQGPVVDCFWTQDDIEFALWEHDIQHYGGIDQDWIPISSHIVHRYWSVSPTQGSPNWWMNDWPFVEYTQWDVDIASDNKYYGWSQPTLQAWMYDTWRVDVVRASRVYQSLTELAAGRRTTVEVVAWFWGNQELPGDQLWAVFDQPNAISVNNADVGGQWIEATYAYAYFPGMPTSPTD